MSKKCVCGRCSTIRPILKNFPKSYLKDLIQGIKELETLYDFVRMEIPLSNVADEVNKQFSASGNCDMTNVLFGTLCYFGYAYYDDTSDLPVVCPTNAHHYFKDEFDQRTVIDFVLTSYTKTTTQLQMMKCWVVYQAYIGGGSPTWNRDIVSYKNNYIAYGYLTYYRDSATWNFLIREFDLSSRNPKSRVKSTPHKRTELILKFCLECKRAGIHIIKIAIYILSSDERRILRSQGFMEIGADFICDLHQKHRRSLKLA